MWYPTRKQFEEIYSFTRRFNITIDGDGHYVAHDLQRIKTTYILKRNDPILYLIVHGKHRHIDYEPVSTKEVVAADIGEFMWKAFCVLKKEGKL